jgi:dienelactone hydrolase
MQGTMNTSKKYLAPERIIEKLAKNKPLLAYSADKKWRTTARTRLTKLLYGSWKPQKIDPRAQLHKRTETSYDIEFFSEQDVLVTGRLTLPDNDSPVPLLICLQGHTLNDQGQSVGVTSLFGEGSEEDREKYIHRGINFAEQAITQGYAVLAIEQRGFGDRKDQRDRSTQAHYGGRCHNPAMGALLFGRTIIGERVHDVRIAISVIAELVRKHNLPVDTNRTACVGHSGGGTTAYYASALDTRINAAMISGAVCQFDSSIAMIDHCVCNYIPNIRTWFEIGDIGCLIAPRTLVVVHGKKDPNFPIEGVRKAMKTVGRAYAAQKKPQRRVLVEGPGVHEFFPKEAWPIFKAKTGW